MSAETRWKLPDWHQRPVRWKVEGMSVKDIYLESYAGNGLSDGGKAHRRSSCRI